MIIVAGALTVDPAGRDAYLDGCVPVVTAAREAPGSGPDDGQLEALVDADVREYGVGERPR